MTVEEGSVPEASESALAFTAAAEVVLEAVAGGLYDEEVLTYYWGSISELNGLTLETLLLYLSEKTGTPVAEPNPIMLPAFKEMNIPDSAAYTIALSADYPRNRSEGIVFDLTGTFSPILIVSDNMEQWDSTAAHLSESVMASSETGMNVGIWRYGGESLTDIQTAQTQAVDLQVWAELLEERKGRPLTVSDTRGIIIIDGPEQFRAMGAGEVEGALAMMANNRGENVGAQLIVRMSADYFCRLQLGSRSRKVLDLGWVLYKNLPIFFGGMARGSAEMIGGIYGKGKLIEELELVQPDVFSERRTGMMSSQIAHWDGTNLKKYWMLK